MMKFLCSFSVGARMKTSIESIRRSISGLGLASDAHGTLRCVLLSNGTHACTAEFSADRITVQMSFDRQEPRLYNESLASLLALSGILADDYDFNMQDLYGYIIEALRQNWQTYSRNQDQKIMLLDSQARSLNESNSVLSNAIVELSGENARIQMQAKPLREFCIAVLNHSKLHRKGPKFLEEIAMEFGMDKELPERVAAALEW